MSSEDGRGLRRRASDLGTQISRAMAAQLKRQAELFRDVRALAAAPDDAAASARFEALLAEHPDDPGYAAALVREIQRKIASEEDSAERIRTEGQAGPATDSPLANKVIGLLQDGYETSRKQKLARLRHVLSAPGSGTRRPLAITPVVDVGGSYPGLAAELPSSGGTRARKRAKTKVTGKDPGKDPGKKPKGKKPKGKSGGGKSATSKAATRKKAPGAGSLRLRPAKPAPDRGRSDAAVRRSERFAAFRSYVSEGEDT